MEKLIRGPNRKDDRSEKVLERHPLNISKGLQAMITAQLFALDAYP